MNPGNFKPKLDAEPEDDGIKLESHSPSLPCNATMEPSFNQIMPPQSVSQSQQLEPILESNQLQYNDVGESSNGKVIYGNLGINTSNPDEALTVVGNIKLTGNIYQPSDSRIKENIEPVS